ncbi:hypothetical protein ACIOEX_21645 [Streptomyces sp. NPDC087850]|uniref:hypothetical protein n=1 Tax=Streptomyces sp. NPDC087850 TaxID=3365809 RepID=UPI00382A8998
MKKSKSPRVPRRHASAIKTKDVTEIFTQSLTESEERIRSRMQWALPLLERQSKGLPGPMSGNPERDHGISVEELVEGAILVEHVAIKKMWERRGRVSYDLNEHFAAELYRSTSDKLPGSVFDHLPHINPLVILPDPWPINGALVRGFFVYGLQQGGRNSTSWVCFTDDPACDSLGMLFMVDVLHPETGEVDHREHVTLHVPTHKEVFTLNDAVQFSVAEENKGAVDKVTRRIFKELMAPALSVLVYLCCDNRDMVEPVPFERQLGTRKGNRQRRDREPFFVEVGWRMGVQLHAARRAAGRVLPGEDIPSGVEHAPHQKSGHFRQVRFGPGLSRTTTKWIKPYWVRLDLLAEGEDPITTVVGVEEQRKDPLRRRSLKGT